jgi:hypothetical protein
MPKLLAGISILDGQSRVYGSRSFLDPAGCILRAPRVSFPIPFFYEALSAPPGRTFALPQNTDNEQVTACHAPVDGLAEQIEWKFRLRRFAQRAAQRELSSAPSLALLQPFIAPFGTFVIFLVVCGGPHSRGPIRDSSTFHSGVIEYSLR